MSVKFSVTTGIVVITDPYYITSGELTTEVLDEACKKLESGAQVVQIEDIAVIIRTAGGDGPCFVDRKSESVVNLGLP